MQVTIEIPDQDAHDLIPEGQNTARTLLEDSVANAFREGRIQSAEQVRRLLGYETRFEAWDFLGKHKLSMFTLEEFERDLATFERFQTREAEKSAA